MANDISHENLITRTALDAGDGVDYQGPAKARLARPHVGNLRYPETARPNPELLVELTDIYSIFPPPLCSLRLCRALLNVPYYLLSMWLMPQSQISC